jgi:epoxyqueuosine reductase
VTVALTDVQPAQLAAAIKTWGRELGFQHVGIADIDLHEPETRLLDWLAAGFHGEMAYMARHGVKRSRPAELVPGTVRAIAARMDYGPPDAAEPWSVLNRPELGYVSRYALGRDYHKVLRQRLQRLAERIAAAIGPFGYRVFVDSAPVLEKAVAEKAGLGWIGKHSNLLDRRAGSWFFLGEIYVDLPLPVDQPATAHCGRCTACLDVCPTQAIVAPYRVDARRCISYHTIELPGPIPLEFRRAIGNRIYGCDDCQLICPWNRFARPTVEPDFRVRHGLDAPGLVELFGWDEAEFLRRTEGSAIRRIGHERWLRNIAVALSNAPRTPAVVDALRVRLAHPSALVREHVVWALAELATVRPPSPPACGSTVADPAPATACVPHP